MKAPTRKQIAEIEASGFFNADWYRAKYPDVDALGMDPLQHYVKYGGTLRRDPSPQFSGGYYLDTHPGAERQGINPLLHLVTRKNSASPLTNNVLWAAHRLSLSGDHAGAIARAENDLPSELLYTLNILRANGAIRENDEQAWIRYLNSYLSHFNTIKISLKKEGKSLLDRLDAKIDRNVTGGPLVSVIMPAWNAEGSIRSAARSILNQSWKNIELIIVDDASTDKTWSEIKSIAAEDSRVKVVRNKQNVGPYVSKNLALQFVSGDYITGHDADDWAVPNRIEDHVTFANKSPSPIKASLTYMVRLKPSGEVGHIGRVTGFSFDGVARKASISCLFQASFLQKEMGYWDSVRFGADSEMIARAQKLLGDGYVDFRKIGMLCLDLETSLTNHPIHGVSKSTGISPVRTQYRNAWTTWLETQKPGKSLFMPFPQATRRYDAPDEMAVGSADINKNLGKGRDE